MNAPTLNLLPLPQYRVERAHIFKSDESLRWFIRQHHAELVELGALVAPTGRQMAVPEKFDAAVVAIGGRMAATRGNRGAA
jgi:hypothetical protein